MFAYCNNNPVNWIDANGARPVYSNDLIDGLKDTDYPDITEELNDLMERNAQELLNYYSKSFSVAAQDGMYTGLGGISYNSSAKAFSLTLAFFVEKVKTNGDWDLKNSIYPSGDYFIYGGELYSGEDIGNIHFGYVGSALYPPSFLHLGAGVYQIITGSKWQYWYTFFDEPRDSEMISYGVDLYKGRKN